MKICSACGTKFSDDINFCVNCGAQLPPASGAAPMGQTGQVPQQPGPMMYGQPQQQQSKSNAALIAVIACLAIAIIAVLVVILFVVKPGSDDNANNGQQTQQTANNNGGNQEQQATAPDVDSKDDTEPTEAPQDIDDSKTDDADVTEYEEYYSSVGDKFEKLAMTTEQSSEFTVYFTALGTAIQSGDTTQCEFNQGKLKELETEALATSIAAVATLTGKISTYEAKKTTKSAKKSAAYITAKTKAKLAEDDGDYKTAKANYNTCLKKLKAADKKAKKKKKKKKKNNSRYTTLYQDDYTWRILLYDYLSDSEVNAMNGDEKRYYLNTLFACYGYRFNDKTIQKFFDYQSWYGADYSISKGNQSAIIKQIKKYDASYQNYKKLTG